MLGTLAQVKLPLNSEAGGTRRHFCPRLCCIRSHISCCPGGDTTMRLYMTPRSVCSSPCSARNSATHVLGVFSTARTLATHVFFRACSLPRQAFYYEKAIKFRRWAADYVQALIEGTYGRRMKKWGFIVDSLINNITFVVKDVHLR